MIPTPGIGGDVPVQHAAAGARATSTTSPPPRVTSPVDLGRFVTGTTIHVDGGNLAAGGWSRAADGVDAATDVKFGVALGALNPHFHLDVTIEAERLGYESVWLPEHLVFTRADEPLAASGRGASAGAARHADLRRVRVPRLPRGPDRATSGSAPTCTTSGCAIRSSRHAACRRSTSLSGGRFEFGIGAQLARGGVGCASGSTSRRAGRRVDEAIEVCKRLWTEDDGRAPRRVLLDSTTWCSSPSRVQQPWPPILVGGESGAALRRAARLGDGWIGMGHTFESAAGQIARLRELRAEHGRDAATFQICLGGPVDVARRRAAMGGARRHPADRLAVAALTRMRSTACAASPISSASSPE